MLLVMHRRLQLLVVSRGETPVAQGIEHVRPMLRSAADALSSRTTVGSSAWISLHTHKDWVACSNASLIHLLNVAAVIGGVLRGDGTAQLRRARYSVVII